MGTNYYKGLKSPHHDVDMVAMMALKKNLRDDYKGPKCQYLNFACFILSLLTVLALSLNHSTTLPPPRVHDIDIAPKKLLDDYKEPKFQTFIILLVLFYPY